MEKFKINKIENSISSKLLKLLILATGMAIAEKAVSQESMEHLIVKAKKYEMNISGLVAQKGELFLENGIPSAELVSDSGIMRVNFTDDSRTNPESIFMCEKGVYYWDINADGKIDEVYVNKKENYKEKPTGEEFRQTKLTMGNPTQTELDLSDMTGKNFVLFDLNGQKIYTTEDATIYKIPEDLKSKIETNLQEKFVEVLKSNSNTENK